MKKNPLIAFLLAFFPGGGLLYIGKPLRGLFYMFAIFGSFFFTIFIASFGYGRFAEESVIFLVFVMLIYFVNFVDTIISASKLYHMQLNSNNREKDTNKESERFFTIVLSFIPGLGHFQLGLMNRGLTLLVGLFGIAAIIFFISVWTSRSEFLIFAAVLPMIWMYGLFDALQQLDKKQRGEKLVDRSILEELEEKREEGKKSKAIATVLSIFPGAGHLYLGLQRRGIQLMAIFLFSIYILDVLRLSLLLFIIPIIWFYSFFDSLQKASLYNKNQKIQDEPIITYFANHQRWIGIFLLFIGLYYLAANILLPSLAPMISRIFHADIYYMFYEYVQTGIVCFLLIAGGLRLLAGSKKQKPSKVEKKQEEREDDRNE
ncbi:hypothetical protein J9303_08960 [Bacillaceae bacterium Marseille-Q3522]|nr:hypothetical protein [Bacillaceae bacterium Marseille-Q3522]